MHPSGRFWFRNCDLGNAVQQAEIIKCARLLIGLDDNNPGRGLGIIPRLPEGWDSIEVSEYTVTGLNGKDIERVPVAMKYSRIKDGFKLIFKAEKPIKLDTVRLGPFEKGSVRLEISLPYKYTTNEIAGRIFVYVSVESMVTELDLSL